MVCYEETPLLCFFTGICFQCLINHYTVFVYPTDPLAKRIASMIWLLYCLFMYIFTSIYQNKEYSDAENFKGLFTWNNYDCFSKMVLASPNFKFVVSLVVTYVFRWYYFTPATVEGIGIHEMCMETSLLWNCLVIIVAFVELTSIPRYTTHLLPGFFVFMWLYCIACCFNWGVLTQIFPKVESSCSSEIVDVEEAPNAVSLGGGETTSTNQDMPTLTSKKSSAKLLEEKVSETPSYVQKQLKQRTSIALLDLAHNDGSPAPLSSSVGMSSSRALAFSNASDARQSSLAHSIILRLSQRSSFMHLDVDFDAINERKSDGYIILEMIVVTFSLCFCLRYASIMVSFIYNGDNYGESIAGGFSAPTLNDWFNHKSSSWERVLVMIWTII